MANRAHQEAMIDRIEETFDIEVEHPAIAPASLPRYAEGIFRRFSRPVSVRVRMELRLKNRLQETRYHHLRDPVRNRGNTQRSRPAVVFGDIDTTYRRRKVAARRQAIPKLVEILRKVLFKLGD